MLKDAGVYLDKEEVAHFINDYFVNVGNVQGGPVSTPAQDLLQDIPDCLEEATPTMEFGYIREVEVSKVEKEINVSKTSGLNNVSSFIVKDAFKIPNPEVTYLMNLSINNSSFPSAWKEALVIPIPKAGNLT